MSQSDQGLIASDEALLRRCPNKPHFVTMPPVDYVTREPKLGLAAFRLVEGDDGVSVYREALLLEKGQDATAVSKEQTCYVFSFESSVVRKAKWDALYAPDSADHSIGHAHSLIAPYVGYEYAKVDKDAFNIVRSHVIAAAKAIVTPLAA